MRSHPRIPGLRNVLSVAFMLAASIIPLQAAAQAVDGIGASPMEIFDLFGTEYGDAFTSVFLHQIFGPLFPSPAGPAQPTVFSYLIGYFNVIIITVAGALLFWNITVGVLQSAHEGKVLGQRWSSLWAAPRVVFSIGLLVALPGLGGYNLAQSGVAYIVRAATNISSELWKSGARMVINGEIPITSAATMMPAETISTMYEIASCMVIVEEQLQKANPSDPLRIGRVTVTDGETGRRTIRTAVVDSSGRASQIGICGQIETPGAPQYIRSVSDETIPGLPQDASTREAANEIFQQMHQDSSEQVYTDMLTLARQVHTVVSDPGQPVPTEVGGVAIQNRIMAIVNSSTDTLSNGVDDIVNQVLEAGGGAGGGRTAQSARNALLTRIEGGNCSSNASGSSEATACMGEGWVGAGSWYMVLARLNNELASLTTAETIAQAGNYVTHAEQRNADLYIATNGEVRGGWFGMRDDSASAAADAGMTSQREASLLSTRHQETFYQATRGLAALGFPMTWDDMGQLNNATNPDSALAKIPGLSGSILSFMDSVINLGSPSGPFGTADPMVGIMQIGSLLVGISSILMGVSLAGGFFTGGASAVILAPIITIMMTTGGTLAFILPLTPFLYWVLAVTGYFLLIVEAVIAVNLWALAHMRLDGEGISGEAGRQGWLMLLSLFLTPALMIFGFFVGMQIFRVTTLIMNLGFSQAFVGIYSGGIFDGFVIMLVYSIVIAVMYMMLIERSFSLVTEFPGKVLRLMGASAELTNGGEGRAQMAVAAGAGATMKATGTATSAGEKIAQKHGVSAKGDGSRDKAGNLQGGTAHRFLQQRSGRVSEGGNSGRGGPTAGG